MSFMSYNIVAFYVRISVIYYVPLLCVLRHSEGAFHYNALFVITLILLVINA